MRWYVQNFVGRYFYERTFFEADDQCQKHHLGLNYRSGWKKLGPLKSGTDRKICLIEYLSFRRFPAALLDCGSRHLYASCFVVQLPGDLYENETYKGVCGRSSLSNVVLYENVNEILYWVWFGSKKCEQEDWAAVSGSERIAPYRLDQSPVEAYTTGFSQTSTFIHTPFSGRTNGAQWRQGESKFLPCFS